MADHAREILKKALVRCGGDGGFYIPPATRPEQNLLAYHRSKTSSRPLADSRRSLPVRRPIPSAARGPVSDAAESRASSLPVPTVAEGITH